MINYYHSQLHGSIYRSNEARIWSRTYTVTAAHYNLYCSYLWL